MAEAAYYVSSTNSNDSSETSFEMLHPACAPKSPLVRSEMPLSIWDSFLLSHPILPFYHNDTNSNRRTVGKTIVVSWARVVMVWLTSVICAVVACVCLYKFLNNYRRKDNSDSELKGKTMAEQSSKLIRNKSDDLNVSTDNNTISPATMMASSPKIAPQMTSGGDSALILDVQTTEKMNGDMPPPPAPNKALAQTPTLAAPQVVAPPSATPTINMPPPTVTRSKSPPRLRPPTVGAAPRSGGPSITGALRPPPSSAASLRIPQQKILSNTSMAPSLSPSSSSSLMAPPKAKSKQVALEPGHSPLDWAHLTSTPNHTLRGKDAPPNQLIKVTPSMLKIQNGRKGRDSWTVYQGKVYNITPYVPFHPGGKGEILRGAGKDSAKLFMEVHPWVNWDGMLAECTVGILVGENETTTSNALDEMD